MKIKMLTIIAIFAVISMGNSPVWKISKGDKVLYIGGTIHVLTKSDYPLPKTFDEAYSKSSTLVFETDIQKVKSPEFQQSLMMNMLLKNGKTLKDVLKAETYSKVEKYFTKLGMPMVGMASFKPSMIALTLTMLELQRLGLIGAGVDEFFSKKAIKDKKNLGKLETVEQQLNFLTSMGEGNEDEMIMHTLKEMEKMPTLLQSMKDAWRIGNVSELDKIGLSPFKKDFPDVYNQFIVKRNNAWMPLIENMIKDDDVEFILVGALHLVGEDGVIEKLEALGYVVEMM